MNTDALKELGKSASPAAKKKVSWRAPRGEDFVLPVAPGARLVFAFDQSLSACGFVAVGGQIRDGKPFVAISAAQRIAVELNDGSTGYERELRRALILRDEIADRALGLALTWNQFSADIEVVHEAPPIGGGRMRSPESSLLAAMAVRMAFTDDRYHLRPMVAPRTHKVFVSGNARATKGEHHAALKQVMADLEIQGAESITNEAHRDALSVALTHFTTQPWSLS